MEQKKSLIDVLENSYEGSDKLLFHYTSLESACNILSSNKLRLSNLANMNDPLEFCKPDCFGFGDVRTDIMKKAMRELMASLQERENKIRLICFCKDFYCKGEWNNENLQNYSSNLTFKGWARSRMWAQYADNHRGVCLVFNKSEFNGEFKKLANNHIKILEPQKITYTNYLNELESAMTDELDVKNHDSNFLHFYLDDERTKYLFQKSEDFRDENEYRFVLIDDNLDSSKTDKFIDFGTSIKAVILGERFSPILKFSLQNNIEQFRINWHCGMPKLIKQ